MRYPLWRLGVFLCAASVPWYWLYLAWTFALGPDPGKVLVDNLGQGALVLLLLTLAMTPLQRVTGWAGWLAVRRQLGLWCFSYALLHLASYLFFLLGAEFPRLPEELSERPYILVGMLGLLGLTALAATSSRWSMRRLGKRWKSLHRLIYVIVIVVLLHMLWVVRADAGRWALYAGIAAILLVLRLPVVASVLGRLRTQTSKGRNKTEING
ncbi:MAG: protein-methionine-sulfoxide reductase heme-binding subunit MsrQ [Pseudomonas sp.]|jgi:sulfoxide reductase heme-binding subunit YedZ|uniref:protein-methionine-sulfoxide reductase heme-binding subunit MsrQ n=1 Tax=Stutzerimonas frequens TaxID=2968969 RepID=UPI001267CDFB|nr:protein-methionine-sulfoxide reductase heme-binding subunit MsrQ [Stutzerimonas frequens]MBA4726545.1 protein-methionine-sulfoxide reductase heme-binding subunit MsrQ [Pseudomonas sp.]MBK3915862.1 protein-methionine-sulfoxide reductase heme-binding subunit MsrQ [Stutzerimonas frequens]MEC7473111.1 protein-methionine-sulfoxide reductase heme-binding subunit MsrQ [Pseudomonadota bacterium]QFU13606.1 Sulfoxide reductase heme-binding subunit YedZ [Stutzerimonas frequens]|tara:strand:- start:148 stop:780 length:633 start_codon:yes stop_codon:yes gene_type:complete